ncbi:MAG: Rossmann-like and DUF2520 domain-containing protein [Alloprevotella sp.]
MTTTDISSLQTKSICLLGTGNVATRLTTALVQNGFRVVGVFGRELSRAERLAALVPGGTCLAAIRLEELPAADIYLFSLSDDALPKVAAQLSCHLAARQAVNAAARVGEETTVGSSSPLWIHTAGSVSLQVFEGLTPRSAVLYPLQTLSRSRNIDFRQEVPLFVEGSDESALAEVTALANALSSRVQSLDSERRKKLHLAAVFACNFVNHCYDLAFQLMEEADADPAWLTPLIDETARKIHHLSPREAQTGPAARNDRSVMERQIEWLGQHETMKEIYRLMSQSIVCRKQNTSDKH